MGLPALAADYLFLAPLIAARLLDRVPDVPVQVCETVQQVLEADRRQRVLMVLWAGDRIADSDAGRAAGGTSQVLHQRWLVMLGLNHVGKPADARNVAAGPLLSQVHKALAGWVPEGAARPLRRASAPMQPTFTESKAVYPLGFEVTLTL
ncbi:MAG: hypothetical protein AMXMBFR78_33840 [Rubrivivax sp.]